MSETSTLLATLRALTIGSYEHAQARVREALAESDYRNATLVGTYPTRVVLLREDGSVDEVPFRVASDQAVVFGESRQLHASVKSPNRTALEEQARALLLSSDPIPSPSLGRS